MQALTGFVYVWTNTINGKKYIGSHIGAESDGYIGSGKAFIRAIEKYGIGAFQRQILEGSIPAEDVRQREQHYLDFFEAATSKNFYNMKPKVDGGFEYINNHPDVAELRKKQGRSISQRWREQGHPKGMLGKHHDEETRERMSRSIKAALVESVGVAVYRFDFDGHLVDHYPSLQAAAAAVKGSASNIKYTCEGRFKAAYNSLWSYTTDPPPLLDRDRCGIRKGVRTPLGEFNTLTAAAQAHGLNPLTIKRKIWKSEPGFAWR